MYWPPAARRKRHTVMLRSVSTVIRVVMMVMVMMVIAPAGRHHIDAGRIPIGVMMVVVMVVAKILGHLDAVVG